MHSNILPMQLQFFADGGDPAPANAPAAATVATSQQNPTTAPAVDYTKIQQMLDGTLAAKEDTALKAYFKQQGLSEDEMKQAIGAFKEQKAAQQPDVTAMQQQLAAAQAATQKAVIDNAAMMVAIGMGLDAKTVPYLLKMADLSAAVGQDGKPKDEEIKKSFEKLLEDLPQLKPQSGQVGGFIQMGAPAGGGTQQTDVDAQLDAIFGIKKK